MSRTARFASISVCLCLVATAWAAPAGGPPPTPVVAYVPGSNADVNQAVLRGVREVFAGRDVRLVVGRAAERWSNAAPETVRLIVEKGARVLITPPDRRAAHLMAQVATRTQVTVVSTSAAPTVGATGSTWVTCVENEKPNADWTAVGRRAGRAALARLER